MGMFDFVDFQMECPTCGNVIKEFQTKDGECCVAMLPFTDVNNFYASCCKCGTFMEFNLHVERDKLTIKDFDMTITAPVHTTKEIEEVQE